MWEAAPETLAEHSLLGNVDYSRGAPKLTVGRLRERLGEVMDWYRHFALTISKKSTLGVDHPLEAGLLGACGACHTAGEVLLGDDGKTPLIDPDTKEEKRRPLHSLQADGCMTGVRFSKSAPRRDAVSTVPNFVERVLPIDAAEGAAFRPEDTAIPGRGVRELCDLIEAHGGRQRPTAATDGSAAAAPAAPSTCNEFVAADAPVAAGSRDRLFDIKGFFGMFCRHRVLINGCHMFSGERQAYLIALLWVFVSIHSVVVLNLEYDIGPCQWLPAFRLFCALAADEYMGAAVKELLNGCLGGMQGPLMRFHFHCHRALCQVTHDGELCGPCCP